MVHTLGIRLEKVEGEWRTGKKKPPSRVGGTGESRERTVVSVPISLERSVFFCYVF